VAKSTTHVDKLGSYDDFKAPWESEAGTETEIDKSKLKKLIFNIKLDHAKSRDSLEDAKADVATAETERDEAKTQAADGSGAEAQKKIDKLTADLQKVTDERDGLVKDKEVAETRAEVLGEFAAKHPKAAKYVKGETKEELEESLKEVAEDWGIDLDNLDGESNDDESNDDEDEIVVNNRPKAKSLLVNPADKDNGKGGNEEYDYDKIAAQITQGKSVFG
jgi:hypothetical protein